MSKIDLYDLGLSERFVQEASLYSEELYLGRVSVQHKEIYKVITECGEMQAEISGKLSFAAATSEDYPAVGDWVLLDRNEDQAGNGIIHHILSRKSCFKRKAAGTSHDNQIIATNIDTIFICMSLNNDYNIRRLERYLSIAWDSMATPVVLLTKSDLCDDANNKLLEIENIAVGADVIVTSSLSGDGYDDVLKYLKKGKTVAFIGSSGVGKSTLINKLMGEEILLTKATREDDRGRHTTTHRQLIMLPSGGIVIDTPGMRELQLSNADFSKAFADIEELASQCFFRDCKHNTEPKCAVKKAIEDGVLSQDRLESYEKLQKEMHFQELKEELGITRASKQRMIEVMGSLGGVKKVQAMNRKNKGNK